MHYKAKEYSKVLDLSEYAKQITLSNAQDSITFARITAYIGYANNKYKNFYSAIDGFKEALNYIPNDKSRGVIRTNYATLYDLMARYYSLKRYKKALTTIKKAEELLYNYDYFSQRQYAQFHQRKFRIYSSLGYHEKAKDEVEKIREITLETKNVNPETQRYSWMRYYRTSLLASYYEVIYLKGNQTNTKENFERITTEIVGNINKLDSIYDNTQALQKPITRTQIWNLSYYLGALYYTSDYFKEIENYEKALEYIEKVIDLSEVAKEPVRNLTEYYRFKAKFTIYNG